MNGVGNGDSSALSKVRNLTSARPMSKSAHSLSNTDHDESLLVVQSDEDNHMKTKPLDDFVPKTKTKKSERRKSKL